MRDPHNIWLFLILILSILRNFVISNLFLFKKKNQKKIFCNENKFQIDFKSETNTPQNSPEPETRVIGFSFPDPRGLTNCHSPNPRIPEE